VLVLKVVEEDHPLGDDFLVIQLPGGGIEIAHAGEIGLEHG